MTLGRDTVQVEQFARTGNVISGMVATRPPRTSVLHYTITVDADGRIARYEQFVTDGSGTVLTRDGSRAVMTFTRDSTIRESLVKGEMVRDQIATPGGAFPLSTIPLNTSALVFEFALQSARHSVPGAKPSLNRLPTFAQLKAPSATPVLYAAPDSVEVDYFGQGRIGFKFDAAGQLVRSDWRATTYRMVIVRVDRADADAFAHDWAAQEASGNGLGRLSPTDTVNAAIGSASVSIAYGRPSQRGRTIWGAVVPWDVVWRLGADLATHIRTDADLVIGDIPLPAGRYTLWMLPSSDSARLIISKLVNVWGTQYTPAQDIARIPMQRTRLSVPVERLTIAVRDGKLVIDWGDASYSVPVRAKESAGRGDRALQIVILNQDRDKPDYNRPFAELPPIVSARCG
ncbi:MAG TPA: DUF2911 domain-containing protein [Gemmatimonadaceae bacterium]|nr:DUF2911 domain-containing protein [Gemmatimonadaceae bacterium]